MLGLFSLFFATMPMARRRHFKLARKRRMIGPEEFERLMGGAGVSATTARWLWKDLQPFYYHPLRPMPGDRLESEIIIDRPEVEGMVTRFWAAMRGGDAMPGGPPLGTDPSIAELGRHCDRLAGWSQQRAA